MDSKAPPRRQKHTSTSSTLAPEPTQRRTRSSSRKEQDEQSKSKEPSPSQPASSTISILPSIPTPIPPPPITLLSTLTTTTTGLSTRALALLRQKRALLLSKSTQHRLASAIAATLVFAQEAGGTAVCVHPSGLLLTCAHCVAEHPSELSLSARHWLLFSSGQVVEARCVAYDHQRDLALLKIVAASAPLDTGSAFPCVALAPAEPKAGAKLLCIGHPGSEDLEADVGGVPTGYDVLHVSYGAFRGYVEGQDEQDNTEIGALMHDCWTYWGHSGAPLVEIGMGKLVGLHSSWDDETGMRRGVGWGALKSFWAGFWERERRVGGEKEEEVECVDLTGRIEGM